ncbi:hypothetical protein HDV05_008259 [Chytridiales sp. JEL 0842]|nr:hypothetical protein HDV05_008259 [Chytridiales sp. JEL 0842]
MNSHRGATSLGSMLFRNRSASARLPACKQCISSTIKTVNLSLISSKRSLSTPPSSNTPSTPNTTPASNPNNRRLEDLWQTPFPSDPDTTRTVHSLPHSSHSLFASRKEQKVTRWITFGVGVLVAGITFAAAIQSDYEDEEKKYESKYDERRMAVVDRAGPVTVGLDQMDQVKWARKLLGVWVMGTNAEGIADPAESRKEVYRAPKSVKAFEGIPLRDLKFTKRVAAAIDVNGDLMLYGSAANNPTSPLPIFKGRDLVQVGITQDSIFALSLSGAVYRAKLNEAVASPSVGDGGDHHVVAVSSSGKVYTIAADVDANKFGQLGNGSIDAPASSLGLIMEPVKGFENNKVVQAAAGGAFNVVRSKDGRAYVWGSNGMGQLATAKIANDLACSVLPIEVKALWNRQKKGDKTDDAACTFVAASGETVLFVVDRPAKTEVYSCGMGQWGQLGHGAFAHMTNVPTLISALSNLSQYSESKKSVQPIRVSSISMSPTHSFAILDDSRSASEGDFGRDVLAWGLNDRGQLGRIDGKKANSATPSWVVPISYSALSTVSEEKKPLAESKEKVEGDGQASQAVPWENTNATLGRMQIASPGWVYGVKGWSSWSAVKCEQGIACGEGVTAIYTKVVV